MTENKGLKRIFLEDPFRHLEGIDVRDLEQPFCEMVSHWTQKTLSEKKVELKRGNKTLGAFFSSRNGYLEYQAYEGKYEKRKNLYMPSLEDFFAIFLAGHYGYVFSKSLLKASHKISSAVQEKQYLQRRKLKRFYSMQFLACSRYQRKDLISLGETGKALFAWRKNNPYLEKISDTEKQVLLMLSTAFWEKSLGFIHRDPTGMRQYVKEWGKAFYEDHEHTGNLAPILQMLSDLESIKDHSLPQGIYLGMPATLFCIDRGEKKAKYDHILARLGFFRKKANLAQKLVVLVAHQNRQELLQHTIKKMGEKHKIKAEVHYHPMVEDFFGFM